MSNETDEISQEDVDKLFEAAASVFFAVVEYETSRWGSTVVVPAWFWPSKDVPCACSLERELVNEAIAFLIRMGIIRLTEQRDLRLVSIS